MEEINPEQQDYNLHFIQQISSDLNYTETQHFQQPYSIVPLEKMIENLNAMLNEVMEVTCLAKGWALLLLKEFKWDLSILKQFYYNDIQHYQASIDFRSELLGECQQTIGTCGICCLSEVSLVRNICGHQFCRKCWILRIEAGLQNQNPFGTCMDEACKIPLLIETVEVLLAGCENGLLKRWRKTVCQQMVMENKNYCFCLRPNCFNCIIIHKMGVQSVKCICSKTFCFQCSSEDHFPLSCKEKADWMEHVKDFEQALLLEKESSPIWIELNTKKCPFCGVQVQKSEGCYCIKCRCGQRFCYMCSRPWQPDHKFHYKCNFYKQQQRQQQIKLNQIDFQNFQDLVNMGRDQLPQFLNQEEKSLDPFIEGYLFNLGLTNTYKRLDIEARRYYLFKYLGLSLQQTEFALNSCQFLISCFEQIKWIYVFFFFTDLQSKEDEVLQALVLLKDHLINFRYLLWDDFILFADQLFRCEDLNAQKKQLLKQMFYALKADIVNQWTVTSQFKENFNKEIQKCLTLPSTAKYFHQKKNLQKCQDKQQNSIHQEINIKLDFKDSLSPKKIKK